MSLTIEEIITPYVLTNRALNEALQNAEKEIKRLNEEIQKLKENK